MRRPTDALRLFALLAVEVAMLGAVLRVGRAPGVAVDLTDPGRWLQNASPEDALVGLLHLTAGAVTVWLLASTLAYVLARLTRLPGAIRATARVTVPAVRRAVERGLATGLVASTLAGAVPAAAQPAPPGVDVTVLTQDGGFLPPGLQPPASGGTAATTPPEVQPLPEPRPRTPAQRVPEPQAAAPGPANHRPTPVRVEPGDNLWVIAERHLTGIASDTPDAPEVARYWRRLVAANRDRLRSGDPDLIHPGEAIELPPGTLGGG